MDSDNALRSKPLHHHPPALPVLLTGDRTQGSSPSSVPVPTASTVAAEPRPPPDSSSNGSMTSILPSFSLDKENSSGPHHHPRHLRSSKPKQSPQPSSTLVGSDVDARPRSQASQCKRKAAPCNSLTYDASTGPSPSSSSSRKRTRGDYHHHTTPSTSNLTPLSPPRRFRRTAAALDDSRDPPSSSMAAPVVHPPPPTTPSAAAAPFSAGPILYNHGHALLPLSLPRPTRFADIDKDNIASREGVPFPYVVEQLVRLGPQLLQSSLACRLAVPPESPITPPLPASLPFDFPSLEVDPNFLPPTHVLAIRPTPLPSTPASHLSTGTLLPIHALVYQTTCAYLPPIAPRGPNSVDSDLPVISLILPSPATFTTLNTYLYTQRPDILLSSLLVIPGWNGACSSRGDLTQYLATQLTHKGLLDRVTVVHGVWGNVCALGIADELLWRALDLSWEVLVGAMALAQSRADLGPVHLHPPIHAVASNLL